MAGAAVADHRQPVIVGTGQINHTDGDAPDPVDLLAEAARRAAADSGAPALLDNVQSVRLVHILSRGYPDPGRLLAETLGIDVRHTLYTTDGGHHPQVLIDRVTRQIQDGQVDTVLVGGVECWKTRNRIRARGERPPWRSQPDDVKPTEVLGSPLDMTSPEEAGLGLRDPTQAYPMIESAIAHRAGRSMPEQQQIAAALWARFSEIAASNPHAALPVARSADEIVTPGPGNRMIGYPYPKLLNSNNSVDQAAAILICSAERARAIGVSPDRWVFLHGAAEANDLPHLTNRWELAASPSIRLAGAAALTLAGAGIDDVAHVDLYSCFPSAVQIAAGELGLALDRPLTVTGGLTFAGGPWNAYVMHSLATMTHRLRDEPEAIGLLSANGGLLTKHAVAVYGATPPRQGSRVENVQSAVDQLPRRQAATTGERDGLEVTVEAFTVMHDRDGRPERAFAFGLTTDGRRALAASDDQALVKDLLTSPPLDRRLVFANGRISDKERRG